MGKKISFFLILSALIIAACDKKQDQPEEKILSKTEINAIEQEMLILQDSINAYRQYAFALEDEKANSTLAMIEEVENVVNGYSAGELTSVKQALDNMKALRYNEVSLGEEAVMLAFDEACDSLLSTLNNFSNNTEEFNRYVRANLLLVAVIEANNQDFFIRKEYNSYVNEYNLRLDSLSNKLTTPTLTKEKFPLFYGEPES